MKTVKELLELSKKYASELYEKICVATIDSCPDYFKLNLWLGDYHEVLDFDAYKFYTITLPPSEQKKFVKKVLNYIHKGKANISVNELTSINVIDFITSKAANQIDGSHLDYSTSIVLNTISELQAQTNLQTKTAVTQAQHRIYDLILKQIKEPSDILEITGFFDNCEGRCKVEVHETKSENGEGVERTVIYNRNPNNIAKYRRFCDGRKAINRTTKEPLLSNEGVEYWWCANQTCFKPSRQLHSSEEWGKYTLLDFLTILQVDFKEVDLEIYLSVINKADNFFKHLKCKECKHILYPKDRTQFAFYGVSNFNCQTENCSKRNETIYLSHCLNGYCERVIDSRDCVKCKPSGLEDNNCGWYICNYCNSCCNTAQLEKRKWVYDNILHTEYKCHLKGHRDLGIICCNKCGNSMDSNEINTIEYERILNWFITNKDTSGRIHKSGENSGKWWFVLKRGKDSYESFREKLTKYHRLGFRIPDFEKDKDFQLISERNETKGQTKSMITCSHCGNTLDYSNDLEKARAVKKFHNVFFTNELSA